MIAMRRLMAWVGLLLLVGLELQAQDRPAKPSGVDAALKQALVKPPPAFDKVLTLAGHSSSVVAVALTGDASRAVTCSDEGDCRVWDLATGRELARYETKLTGKQFCVAITPDGRHALVGGEFKAVHVWDAKSGKRLFTHTGPPPAVVTRVDVSADGKWMAMLDKEAGIFIYPTLGGQGHTMHVPGKQFSDLALTPKGKFAVVARRSGRPMAAFFPTKNTRRVFSVSAPKSLSFDKTYAIDLSSRFYVYSPVSGDGWLGQSAAMPQRSGPAT